MTGWSRAAPVIFPVDVDTLHPLVLDDSLNRDSYTSIYSRPPAFTPLQLISFSLYKFALCPILLPAVKTRPRATMNLLTLPLLAVSALVGITITGALASPVSPDSLDITARDPQLDTASGGSCNACENRVNWCNNQWAYWIWNKITNGGWCAEHMCWTYPDEVGALCSKCLVEEP
jgi:hypothetical protein